MSLVTLHTGVVRRLAALFAGVAIGAPIAPIGGGVPAQASATLGRPCALGWRTHYTHVAWIVLENVGVGVVGSPQAPVFNGLAARCGLAVDDHGVAHPSLPNYLAITAGTTAGVRDDGEPSAHPIGGPSLFSQLHGRWRALEESMPQPCDRVTSGLYAARHNPAVYYTALGPTCARDDVTLTWPLQLGAPFTFITPNVCDDMHSCPIATGDAWLARAVSSVVASPQYRAGTLVLFITFDENDGDATNQVPTLVIAPSVPRGLRVTTPYSHYSLLATTEALLGLARLGLARDAPTFIGPFHL